MVDFSAVSTVVSTKLLPALGAIGAQLPGLLSSNAADVQTALTAVLKVITDLQSDITTLVGAVKSAT